MAFETLIAAIRRHNTSVEAFAALGAESRLRGEGRDGDPVVRDLLRKVVHEIDPQLLDGVDANQAATALGIVQAFFHQATDLLENPARAPGWIYDDPVVLQAQGQGSRVVIRAIEAVAAERPRLRDVLQRPGAFLDIGTGVGWLAIEAAWSWPALTVVGIDPWPPSLALARTNLATSGMAARIELRSQAIEALEDRDAFTLAYLPLPFLPEAVIDTALVRVHRALTRDGFLVALVYAPLPSALDAALTALRTVRGGGHPWETSEIEERMRRLDFAEVESFEPPGAPVHLVLGRRAA